jgi:divalent metal cation (Fe/Co/Zn/Cd) transporter
MKRKSLWKITLKQMRLSIGGDDSFRSKVQEYSENQRSNPLLSGLIVSVVGMAATSGLPLDSALATFIVLYVLKVGLNTFCESTESDADG